MDSLAQFAHTNQDAPSTRPTCLHLAHIPLNLSYPYTYPNGLLDVGIVPASATFSGSLFHIPITLCVEKVAPWVCIKSFLPYLKPMSSGY